MSINIVGFSSAFKVPGFWAETVFRAGGISLASIPIRLLVSGTQLSTGTATADQDIVEIISLDDSDAYHGAGSEINLMCQAALRVPGVRLYAAANAEAGGAVAAAATITIGGSWTTSGEWAYRLNGVRYTGATASTDTIQIVATAIAAAFNSDAHSPATAAVGAGPGYVVTLTMKSKGARGNDYVLWQEKGRLASGMTSVMAGGSDVSGTTNQAIKFASGSGTDTVTTLLTKLLPGLYDRNAVAQNDATAMVAWRNQARVKAGVLEGRLEHIVAATNAASGTATSLAGTSINDERVQLWWQLNSERHPSQHAAVMGATRVAAEQDDPSAYYDGQPLVGAAPQAFASDVPTTATQSSMLDNGVTPLTTVNGEVQVVRSIVTHCLNGASPDYRCLDTYQAVIPDYVRNAIGLYWTTVYKVGNPKVNSDPDPSQRDRPAGVATPKRWNQAVYGLLKGFETNLWITDVDDNLPVSEFNTAARRIMSIIPVIPSFANHQTGISVRQTG